jgi:uncharacterized damage-inducible protein DinB
MMTENYLVRLFEFNNWANRQIIEVCLKLSDEQLDAPPAFASAPYGSIRKTLVHLIAAQQRYLHHLTLPLEVRNEIVYPDFADEEAVAGSTREPFLVEAIADSTGEAFLALVRGETNLFQSTQIHTPDGYIVEPWVLMVQVINHSHEHREQIKSMLSALGITPPEMDGWMYGDTLGALVKIVT